MFTPLRSQPGQLLHGIGARDLSPSIRRLYNAIDNLGRDAPPEALEEVIAHVAHPSPVIREAVVESLSRLDTAEADQWIVAMATEEQDPQVRWGLCRAAEHATLPALAPTLTRWALEDASEPSFPGYAFIALGHTQARSALSTILNQRSDLSPGERAWAQSVIDSAPVGRSGRDRMTRQPAVPDPAWEIHIPRWTVTHEDGTVTNVLDDGSAMGPDFRRQASRLPKLSWWPAGMERQGRLALRRDMRRLFDELLQTSDDRFLVAVEAGLDADLAPVLIDKAVQWLDDEATPLLESVIDADDPLLRATAWRAISKDATHSDRFWLLAVERLGTEDEPAVRHMLVETLYGLQEPSVRAAVASCLRSSDHVERALACNGAVGLLDYFRQSLTSIQRDDPSRFVRDVARKALSAGEL